MTDKGLSILNRPFLPVCASLILGILGAYFFLNAFWVWALPLAALLVIAGFLFRSCFRFFLSLLLFFLFGFISGYYSFETPSEGHIYHWKDKGRIYVTGQILDIPRPGDRSLHLCLHQLSVHENGKTPVSVKGKMGLSVYGYDLDFIPGQWVSFSSRLKPFHNFGNPGGFDYTGHMNRQNIWVRGYASAKIIIYPENGPDTGVASLHALRFNISKKIQQITGDPTGVMRAILVGDKTGISLSTRRAVNRSGIGHLLAISGLHIGMVAAAVFGLARMLVSWVPFLRDRGWVSKVSAAIAFTSMISYGVLAGLSPSTQRAMIMVGIFLVGVILGRSHDLVNTVAAAATLILVIDPGALFSGSFQLSFIAVISILIGLSFFPKKGSGAHQPGHSVSRLKHIIISTGVVTISATIGTAPLIMAFFHQMPLVGIFSNLIVVPWVGWVVLPLGLSGMVFLPVFPLAGSFLLKCSNALLIPAIDISAVVGNADWSAITTFIPSATEILMYYMGCGALVLAVKTWMPDKFRTLWCFVCIIISGFAIYTSICWFKRHHPRNLSVQVLDVGQGSSVMAVLPGGHTMLIDGGGFSGGTFDVGERVVLPALLAQKIMRIDTMVVTHPDSDHLKGLIAIVETIPVGVVWTNGDTPETDVFRRFMDEVNARNIPVFDVRALPDRVLIDNTHIRLFHPRNDGSFGTENDASIVMKLSFGARSVIIPGDISKKIEGVLCQRYSDNLRADLLIAPHHGSAHSSSNRWIDTVRPASVIFSCGWRNRYGFPKESVLKRYQQIGAGILRTDTHGRILWETDGDEMQTINTWN